MPRTQWDQESTWIRWLWSPANTPKYQAWRPPARCCTSWFRTSPRSREGSFQASLEAGLPRTCRAPWASFDTFLYTWHSSKSYRNSLRTFRSRCYPYPSKYYYSRWSDKHPSPNRTVDEFRNLRKNSHSRESLFQLSVAYPRARSDRGALAWRSNCWRTARYPHRRQFCTPRSFRGNSKPPWSSRQPSRS